MLARWMKTISAAVMLASLAVSSVAAPGAASAQDRGSSFRFSGEFQVADRDNDRRYSDRRYNDRRGSDRRDWNRGDRNRRDWDGRRDGPRWDRWDRRYDTSWRSRPWYWNRPAYVWGPPRYVYPPRAYYRGRLDPWDVIVWGVLPAAIYYNLAVTQREYHQYAYNQAMAAPVGETIIWEDGGTSGTIQTTRDGHAGDRYCREFQQTISIDGEKQQGFGVACQEPDGSWRLAPGNASDVR